MFREIRRKCNEINAEEAGRLLAGERRGVLSVCGDDGYPYGVPVNYLYRPDAGKIYFHGAAAGHKADAIRRCDKVCFTVFGGESVRGEPWAPYVKSAVVFGRCRIVENEGEKLALVREFARKYYPDETLIDDEIARAGKAVRMFEITVEHLSGKEIQER